jgi:hypothetical protein
VRSLSVASIVSIALKVFADGVSQRRSPVAGVAIESSQAAVLGAKKVNILDCWCHKDGSGVSHIVGVCLENGIYFGCAHLG